MSQKQKEEGTSYYRSGIYDVVSVPQKQKTQHKIVRDESSPDLRDVLHRLSVNVEENTRAIRALHSHLNAGGDRSHRRRHDRVPVYVRVAILRVIDVDTVTGTFSADVFLQASWMEPALASASQEELDDMDFDSVWKPNIIVTNLAGTPDNLRRWYGGFRPQPDQKVPLLYLRMTLRAKFKENLQLASFPVDTQALSVIVATERSESEVHLVEDLATVNTSTFQDQSEFTLHQHVEVERVTGQTHGLDIYERSPKLSFQCHVTRRPSFYFWNMFLILFLLTGLMLVDYTMAPNVPQDRFKVSLTLLLIVVAYKFVMLREMPKIPFMSLMGGYLLTCILFLVWQNIQNAIIALIASASGMAYAEELDTYFFGLLTAVFILFNIIYFAIIIVKYVKGQNSMAAKDDAYKNKLSTREVYKTPDYNPYDQRRVPRNHVDPKPRRSRRKHEPVEEDYGEVYEDRGASQDPEVVPKGDNTRVYITN